LAYGVVSHREELIQCIALNTHCGVLAGCTHGGKTPCPELNSAGLNLEDVHLSKKNLSINSYNLSINFDKFR
jgi:hypothetical protein